MEYIAKINIGDTVTLKTDSEKLKRICTGICVRNHLISYDLACGSTSSWHYDIEIEHEEKRVRIGF